MFRRVLHYNCPVKSKTQNTIILLILLINAGCSVNIQEGSGTTPTPFLITSTLPPSLTPPPSETPLPPPPQPTIVPVEGTSSTQINVRAQPSTAGEVLGVIAVNTKIQIVGKDPGGNWWQIIYPTGVDGKGWVAAQYVKTADKPEVPVIGGGGADPNNGNVAIIQQKLNVRSGPGTGFNSIGTLNPQDVVNLTGKDANGAWLQIEFASGPEGKGWINSAFAQAKGVENLSIITEAGAIVGTGTPTGIPLTPTATILPARMDNDSQNSPVVSVRFESTGTRILLYNGDVSAPEGDLEDWIAFTPYSDTVLLSLDCKGDGALTGDVLENGTPMGLEIKCGERLKAVDVKANASYLVHVGANPSSSGMQYINYTITIKTSP